MKSGYVAIVGRPNVGKSTLLNALLDTKLAITTNVAGTTRNTILGIYHQDNIEIIFVDTPGIHKPEQKLGTYLNNQAYYMTKEVDIILFLIDAASGFGKGDMFILNRLKEEGKPVFLLMNKIDQLTNEQILMKINEYKDIYPFSEIIPISALRERNLRELIKTITTYLPRDHFSYNNNELTNVSKEFLIAEYVREKLLLNTKKEIPHTITCFVEQYEELDKIVNISVVVVVDRENIKKIIIGKNGSMLKKVGTLARQDIENFLGKKVFLELHVKVIENWREREKYLQEFGFYNQI